MTLLCRSRTPINVCIEDPQDFVDPYPIRILHLRAVDTWFPRTWGSVCLYGSVDEGVVNLQHEPIASDSRGGPCFMLFSNRQTDTPAPTHGSLEPRGYRQPLCTTTKVVPPTQVLRSMANPDMAAFLPRPQPSKPHHDRPSAPMGLQYHIPNGSSRHRATVSGPTFDRPRSPPNTKSNKLPAELSKL